MESYEMLKKYTDAELDSLYFQLSGKTRHHIGTFGSCYFISDGESDFVKIGMNSNGDIRQRLNSLQIGNPRRLILIGFIIVDIKRTRPMMPRAQVQDKEHELHEMLQSRRGIGEWFSVSESEIRSIPDIKMMIDGLIGGNDGSRKEL